MNVDATLTKEAACDASTMKSDEARDNALMYKVLFPRLIHTSCLCYPRWLRRKLSINDTQPFNFPWLAFCFLITHGKAYGRGI